MKGATMKRILLSLIFILALASQGWGANLNYTAAQLNTKLSASCDGVSVSGVTRAIKCYNGAGTVTGIEIINDAAVGTLYADATVVGSLAWAAANLPANGVLIVHPGTYQVDRMTTWPEGITIFGNGAVIKRINQISTTTTTGITSGATSSIVVASTAGFLVGQSITVLDDDGATYSAVNHTISSIVGTTITVSEPFYANCAGTTGVHLSFSVFRLNGGKIHGIEFDGNKANWTNFYRWENTHEIFSFNDRNHVVDCYIHDAPGEGIFEARDGTDWNHQSQDPWNIYKNNRISQVNGNGIHLSASIAPLVDGNYIEYCNLQGTTMGHNGGAISFSAQIKDARIINNHLLNSRAGVGLGGGYGASNTIIRGNTIRDMSVYAIDFIATTQNERFINVGIEGNKIVNSVQLIIACNYTITDPANPTGTTVSGSNEITTVSSMTNIADGMSISGTGIPADSIIIGHDNTNSIVYIGDRSGSPKNCTANGSLVTLSIIGEYPEKVQVNNNQLINTGLVLQRIASVSVAGNTFEFYPSDITSQGILVNYALSRATISGNTFRYGLDGILTTSANLTDVTISANTMTGGYSHGMYIEGTNVNLAVIGNVINSESNSQVSDFQGIRTSGGGTYKNNRIKMLQGYATIRVTGAGDIIQGNWTNNGNYTGSGRYNIKVESGATGVMVINNQCNDVVSDAGTSTLLRDNDAF
jgi:hypothetical protein